MQPLYVNLSIKVLFMPGKLIIEEDGCVTVVLNTKKTLIPLKQ